MYINVHQIWWCTPYITSWCVLMLHHIFYDVWCTSYVMYIDAHRFTSLSNMMWNNVIWCTLHVMCIIWYIMCIIKSIFSHHIFWYEIITCFHSMKFWTLVIHGRLPIERRLPCDHISKELRDSGSGSTRTDGVDIDFWAENKHALAFHNS